MEIYSIMKIDGILGGGATNPLITDKEYYKDWIEVEQYSMGLHMSESQSVGAGKASFNDIFIKKDPDKASPHITLACMTGRKIKSITIEFYDINPSGNKKIQKYAIYKFNDCIMSSWYQNSMSIKNTESPQSPVEQVAFNYQKIEFTYLTGKPTGETIGFDLIANKLYNPDQPPKLVR
jgi:type VI secretion system secreted protein Hcp